MTRPYLWAEMRPSQFTDALREDPIVIVPVGSVEQHGPHCPVDLDIDCPYQIACRAAEQCHDLRVLVAPPVWSGFTPHNMHFPGTINLRMETFTNLIFDVCSSIAFHGFKRILVLNGHGGNESLLNAISIKLSEVGICVAVATYFRLIGEEINEVRETPIGGMGHACEFETSLELYFRPQLVDMASAVAEPRVALSSFFPKDMFAKGTVFYPPIPEAWGGMKHGVMGDPTSATAEKGRRITEMVLAKLTVLLHELRQLEHLKREER